MALARAREARAGIGVARAALYPQVEGRVAAGLGAGGNYLSPWGTEYFDPKQSPGSVRGEFGLSVQQLIYDFGATGSDINRSLNDFQSQAEQAVEASETLAQNVADAYLKILEQTELLSVSDQNLTELRRIGRLVEENEKAGNATTADTKRVKARIAEGEQSRSDTQLGFQIAVDRFKLLVGAAPGKLSPAPSLQAGLPADVTSAFAMVETRNPRLKSAQSATRAARNEIDQIKGQGNARIEFQGDVTSKNYDGVNPNSEADARGMLAFRYKFMDGGLNSSRIEQAAARLQRAEMRYLYEKDDITSQLRQAYQQLGSARGKMSMIQDGVNASAKARELYLEQFSGGKRSLLELLDVQASWYLAQRNDITNRFDTHRACYSILKATGGLTRALLGGRTAKP